MTPPLITITTIASPCHQSEQEESNGPPVKKFNREVCPNTRICFGATIITTTTPPLINYQLLQIHRWQWLLRIWRVRLLLFVHHTAAEVVLREEEEGVHHLHFINGLHPLLLKRRHLRIIIITLTVAAVVEVEWCPLRQVESFVNHAMPLALTESEVEELVVQEDHHHYNNVRGI
jgi:hypothetical protein